MRRHVTLALAAAVALGVASQAQAAITVSVTTINPNRCLLSHAWWLLVTRAICSPSLPTAMLSDGTTEVVSSVDFSNTVAGLTGPIGIYTTGGANIIQQGLKFGSLSTPTYP